MSQSLHSHHGVQALLRVTSAPPLLLGLDLDGTLAPLCDHPDQVRLSAELIALLLDLEQYCHVAILSGRSRENLKRLCEPLQRAVLIGNHGIDSPWIEPARIREARNLCQSWGLQLRSFDWPQGAWVEEKQFSLSLHYRHTCEPVRAESQIRSFLPELRPAPRVIGGKFVLNVLPSDAPDKGQALASLHDRLRPEGIIHIGDDITDEHAFNWMRVRERQVELPLLGIRVGADTRTAAPFHLEGQEEVPTLLRELLGRVSRFAGFDR